MAIRDVATAIDQAKSRLASATVEQRFAIAHLLSQINVPSCRPTLIALLADDDLRVAARCLATIGQDLDSNGMPSAHVHLFDAATGARL